MNHTSCLLVLLVAMKMLAVRSAPLMAIEDSDVSKSDESSDPRSTELVDSSDEPDKHEMIPVTTTTAKPKTSTPGHRETPDTSNAAEVKLMKEALRNKRAALRCPGGLWICPTNSWRRVKKARNNHKHHHNHKQHRS